MSLIDSGELEASVMIQILTNIKTKDMSITGAVQASDCVNNNKRQMLYKKWLINNGLIKFEPYPYLKQHPGFGIARLTESGNQLLELLCLHKQETTTQ